jgi:hypothetical protein
MVHMWTTEMVHKFAKLYPHSALERNETIMVRFKVALLLKWKPRVGTVSDAKTFEVYEYAFRTAILGFSIQNS